VLDGSGLGGSGLSDRFNGSMGDDVWTYGCTKPIGFCGLRDGMLSEVGGLMAGGSDTGSGFNGEILSDS
jgi:hypothetical protein